MINTKEQAFKPTEGMIEGTTRANHRFSMHGEWAQYASTGENALQTELAETDKTVEELIIDTRTVRYNKLLDLTDPAVRQSLGVTLEEIARKDTEPESSGKLTFPPPSAMSEHMNASELKDLLDSVARGAVSTGEAADILARGPFRATNLGFATLDHHRALRHGLGEVVYGEGKTASQLVSILEKLSEDGRVVLSTRLDAAKRAILAERFSSAIRNSDVARTFTVNAPLEKRASTGEPFVALLAAGTSDMPVAEEAAETLVAMGAAFERVYDVGVAGLHRLLGRLELIQKADAVVVVAGMEGALPSVVGGLVGRPVFAVPTSVGYGANFGGLSALLGMLNSCAPGVSVTNIDNGFSAAFAAAMVVRAVKERLRKS